MTTQGFTLNLYAKEPTPNVKYNSKSIQINHKQKELKADSAFILNNLQEEVKNLKLKQRKRYVRIAKATLLTSLSILTFANPLLASAQISTVAVPVLATVANTTPDMIMPADVMKVGVYLIGIFMAISTILSILLYQISGGYRMLRKSKEATEWQSDIIKGFTQTLIAPVIIVTIAFLAYLLFGNLPYFAKPF